METSRVPLFWVELVPVLCPSSLREGEDGNGANLPPDLKDLRDLRVRGRMSDDPGPRKLRTRDDLTLGIILRLHCPPLSSSGRVISLPKRAQGPGVCTPGTPSEASTLSADIRAEHDSS